MRSLSGAGNTRVDNLEARHCQASYRVFRIAPVKYRRLKRCNAGERWEPNSFNPLLWGQSLMKRLDKESRAVEAEPADTSESAAASPKAENAAAKGEARQHPEVEYTDEVNASILNKRRQDYRHLVFCGRDVTLDYPAEETPTWDSWQAAIELSSGSANMLQERRKSLEEAIKEEDYSTAADLKKAIDEISEEDTVNRFIQDYRTAIEEENFAKAGELLEGCSIDLCGWWSVNTPDAAVGNHILRISKAFNRYKFDAFSPEELAGLHGMASDMSGGEELSGTPPTSEMYNTLGTTVADLHFLPFPSEQEPSGQRIYSLASAIAMPSADSNVGEGIGSKIPLSGMLGDVSRNSDEADKPIDLEGMVRDFLKSEPSSGDEAGIIEVQPGQISEDGTDIQIVVESAEQIEGDGSDGEDISQSLISRIQSQRAKHQNNRVPLNLLRTEKDRIMLVVAPTASSEALLRDSTEPDGSDADSVSSSERNSDGNSRVSIIAINGETSAEEIAAKLKDLLKRDPASGGAESRMLKMPDRRQLRDRLRKLIDDIGIEPGDSRDEMDQKTHKAMARRIAKHFKNLMDLRPLLHISATGLKGAVGYSRIRLPENTLDPFSGLFIGMFGPHGPEVIEMRRAIGEDGVEYVEGVKVTGDANVPAGNLSFRAAIAPENKMPSTRYLPPELGIRARYKGQGQIAETGFRNPRWVDGELWHLSSNNALGQAAEIGFLYTIGDNKILTPLNRIYLDDCLGNLTR